jgi:hypothetical protein
LIRRGEGIAQVQADASQLSAYRIRGTPRGPQNPTEFFRNLNTAPTGAVFFAVLDKLASPLCRAGRKSLQQPAGGLTGTTVLADFAP